MVVASVEPPAHNSETARVHIDGASDSANVQFHPLFAGLADPPVAAYELLLAAAAAWIADRSIPRGVTADRWTRRIELAFPSVAADRWPTEQLARILRILTNDEWFLTAYQVDEPLQLAPAQQQLSVGADRVSLFSGGLDSFGHAVAVAEGSADSFLVGHWDMAVLAALQRSAAVSADRDVIANGRLRLFHVGAPASLNLGREAEITSRSRGLLYLSAGIAVASAAGIPILDVPENGLVALNVPLTTARGGALSTRSTHPRVLQLVGELTRSLGIDVTPRNPWLYATKGDVVRAGIARGEPAIAATVSCSHPTGDRWRGDGRYRNCGYCYPCLVRRAGVESAMAGRDPTCYRLDPRTDPSVVASDRRADLVAVAAAIARVPVLSDVFSVAPLPRDVDVTQLHDMRVRSFDELATMLDRSLDPRVRKRLGL